jgi:LuxR family quorum sensing-dependent transcriptional regulator
MIQRLIDRLHEVDPGVCERVGQLTVRERQIVLHTSYGKTSNEIADELGISPRTVFAHLTSAGEKLKATNKTETVVNAFRYNQIPI